MDTNKMMVCALAMMVLISTSCKARYVDDDSEEAKALDKRRAMYDAFFKRGFAKRQEKLVHLQPHYIDQ
jgi:formiminotetrahydrofolate cyclodeaminase